MKFLIILAILASCAHKTPDAPDPTPTPPPTTTETGREVLDCKGGTIRGPVKVYKKNGYTVQNCKIVGFEGDGDPIGIDVKRSKDVLIQNNDISEINETDGNAHIVLVENSDSVRLISNTLHHSLLGSSEALSYHSLNGEIRGNKIHSINNIGIDVMGCEEGRGPGKSVVIAENHVYDIGATPKYVTRKSPANIYVDCGFDVLIEKNIVENGDVGIEIGSEKSKKSENIKVFDNVIRKNRKIGLKVGTGAGVKGCQIRGNDITDNEENYRDEGKKSGRSDCVAPAGILK